MIEYETATIFCSNLHWCNCERTWYNNQSLIDLGFEVTFFQDFLLPKWELLPSNWKIRIKGVHSPSTYLELVQSNVSIILGNKILNIPLVLQYNCRYDILLGNDFLKQFAKFTQTP